MDHRQYLRLMSPLFLITVAAGLPVSALPGLVQVAMTFYTGRDGKSMGPAILLGLGAPLLLPVALVCGYAVVRVWTGLAWAGAAG